MCDTWVALHNATLTGQVIFAKNSDRPIFDCQPLVLRPRQTWPPGSRVAATYIELDQVSTTWAHLGSGPYWCWGYEEGLNEHGVVIGNEAVFTRTFREAALAHQAGRGPALGLLGMDLIRLALERATSARAAVALMGALIERYGQFGSGVPGKGHPEGGYDNAFIVADPAEAWVLEAVGHRWAARQVGEGCASISNQLSLRGAWDLGSDDLQAYTVAQGWWPPEVPFDFARAYTDEHVPRQVSHIRASRSRQLLAERAGQITPRWMQRIARDHYEDTFLGGPYFDAADPDFLTLCMHVSPADFTWGNTATACIAELPVAPGALPVFWWTPGPPCNGCYVPFFVHGSQLPEMVSRAGTLGRRVTPPNQVAADGFSPDSYWWLFRRLMDVVKGDELSSMPACYSLRNQRVRAVFDALERDFEAELSEVTASVGPLLGPPSAGQSGLLDAFTERCVQKAAAAAQALLAEFGGERAQHKPLA